LDEISVQTGARQRGLASSGILCARGIR